MPADAAEPASGDGAPAPGAVRPFLADVAVGTEGDPPSGKHPGRDAAHPPLVDAAFPQPYFLDAAQPGANKGAVVRRLARMPDRPAASTASVAAVGDPPSGVLTFREGGVSAAAGDAPGGVKRPTPRLLDLCVIPPRR